MGASCKSARREKRGAPFREAAVVLVLIVRLDRMELSVPATEPSLIIIDESRVIGGTLGSLSRPQTLRPGSLGPAHASLVTSRLVGEAWNWGRGGAERRPKWRPRELPRQLWALLLPTPEVVRAGFLWAFLFHDLATTTSLSAPERCPGFGEGRGTGRPRGTYIVDEVSDVCGAGGQRTGRLGRAQQNGAVCAAAWRRGRKGHQFCWVAQLVHVVGVLRADGARSRVMQSSRVRGLRASWGPWPTLSTCKSPRLPHLVLPPLLVVVKDVVPEVVLQSVQKPLVQDCCRNRARRATSRASTGWGSGAEKSVSGRGGARGWRAGPGVGEVGRARAGEAAGKLGSRARACGHSDSRITLSQRWYDRALG